jgi:hypothetical protein
MSRAILVPTLALIASFGFASQAFGHAGTPTDPLPAAQASKGTMPHAVCPPGAHELYHRTTQPNNDPKHLKAACYGPHELAAVQSAHYASEKPGAKHAGTVTDPLPAAVASKGTAPSHPSCAAGTHLLYHRTSQPNNDPKHLQPACYKEADLKAVQAAKYAGEK